MQSIADFRPSKKLELPKELTFFDRDWVTFSEPGDTQGNVVTRWAQIDAAKPIKMPKPKSAKTGQAQDVRMELMMERIFENMQKNQK